MNINNTQESNCKSVAFLTLGCKVNSYETEAMQKIFEDAGYRIVDFNQHSDVYVVNTCTVTNIADRKSRQMLHKARKMNEDAIVVAVGCYVQTAEKILEQDEAIDIVIGNNKKKDIIRILDEYYKVNKNNSSENKPDLSEYSVNADDSDKNSEQDKIQSFTNTLKDNVIDIASETEYEDLSIESVSEKTRAYIKIQDGCNQFCSYCIIPYARGRVRSREEKSIIKEVENLVLKGYKEIVLTGIHLSSYGVDLEKKNLLLDLIVNLSKIDGLKRIRLGSLEPRIITEEFAETLSKDTKICPHFHLSLQSGSDATLKRMNRKYTAQEYYEKCLLLRKYFINPAITTDIIVGFPGETEEEFTCTENFLRKVSFAQMHIFKYSIRKGTAAERMPNQVRDEIKTDRSNVLIDLEEGMAKEYQSLFLGKIENILIEETITVDGLTYQIGHNERYLKLAVSADKDLTNQMIQGKVSGYLNKDIMFCEIMD